MSEDSYLGSADFANAFISQFAREVKLFNAIGILE